MKEWFSCHRSYSTARTALDCEKSNDFELPFEAGKHYTYFGTVVKCVEIQWHNHDAHIVFDRDVFSYPDEDDYGGHMTRHRNYFAMNKQTDLMALRPFKLTPNVYSSEDLLRHIAETTYQLHCDVCQKDCLVNSHHFVCSECNTEFKVIP